ncbi:NACHT domain-containing protein [Actinokineospora sp. NBRC 105648]|uniref:NACHT domain-containing protein n=1 Tax=Actinokineospora sp. NBRC 105648 TaxID=3032206 RepID=UPI0024A15D50|nr:NACHT domain-containing protein [Actinokineospora sp. NBRC 105648]GLZ43290.1 hypothetical protein Acsp05_69140 [Actinokineospora sp. NBRC 105648]
MTAIDQFLSRKAARFDKHYRDFVSAGVRRVDLQGLATKSFYTPDLEDVFVDVGLVPRAAHNIEGHLLPEVPHETIDRRSLETLLDHESPSIVAVIGSPGSGKTTLLRHTTRKICRRKKRRRRPTPILLFLRDHVRWIISTPQDGLASLLTHSLTQNSLVVPLGWFEQRLQSGDCVVFLDGLDEIALPEHRKAVAEWIEVQTTRYAKNDFVITSRPHGYRTTPIDGATVVQVQPFSEEQVKLFVHRWYEAVERHGMGNSEDDDESTGSFQTGADDLLDRLKNSVGLADLTANPLLLTMIVNVHRHRGALPGSRVELYGEICQVMLWRRQEAKKLTVALRGDKRETLLQKLAFTMMEQRVRDLPKAKVLGALRPSMRRLSKDLSAEEFLDDLGVNGLLIEREAEVFSFCHHTFQEYLASAYIQSKGRVDVLVENVDDIWWRETAILYASRADADRVINACITSGSVTALALAFDCVEQDGDVDPDLRARLDDLTRSASDLFSEFRVRQLMTGVLIARHFRHFVSTSTRSRVCTQFLTAAMYRLYQQQTMRAHPHETDSEDGASETSPAQGMLGREAVGFIGWVNEITGSSGRYRLPTTAELDDPFVGRALETVVPEPDDLLLWATTDDTRGRLVLWSNRQGAVHPHSVSGTVLVQYCLDDLRSSANALDRVAILIAVQVSSQLVGTLSEVLNPVTAVVPSALVKWRGRATKTARELHKLLSILVPRHPGLDAALTLADFVIVSLTRNYQVSQGAHRDRVEVAYRLNDLITGNRLKGLEYGIASLLAFEDERAIYLPVVLDQLVYRAVRELKHGTRLAEFTDNVFTNLADAVKNLVRAGSATDLDSVMDQVVAGKPAVIAAVGGNSWASRVLGYLERVAGPVFAGQVGLTQQRAAAIRVMALLTCLELRARGVPALGAVFLDLALAVTLLQRRDQGLAPMPEMVTVAVG